MKFINIISLVLLLNIASLNAKSMDIYAQVSAKILYIASVNKSVKKDELLVKFDNSEIKYKIKAQEAKVKLKKLFFEDANKNYLEDKELYEKTVISQRTLDISKLKNFKAKYEYEEQEAILNLYKQINKKYIIKAPFNCTVKEIKNNINASNINNNMVLMSIE